MSTGKGLVGVVDTGLTARADGGPVRLRRNGRQPKAVGLYFSVKCGEHLPYESKLELHDLWRAEVDADVLFSRVQPFTIQLVVEGRLRRYTPDRLDLLADGSQLVVEVKDAIAPDEAVSTFTPIAKQLAARGLRFELRQREWVDSEPSLSGVIAVQRHRRTRLSPADVLRLEKRLEDGPAAFGEVAGALGAGPVGVALVCAAAVRRHVCIDLGAGLHGDSRVEWLS